MRVVLYSAPGADQPALQRVLEEGGLQVRHGRLRVGELDLRGTDCVVWACRASMPHGSLVAEIDRYAAAVPIVLVSDRAAPAIEALSAIRFAGIVWRDDVPRRLVPSIREAVVHTRYRTMARRVGAAQLPPLLTRALVLALRTAGGEPIRKPAELAAALRCSPITLSQEFRRAVGGAFTLDDFLGAIQVMRVSQLRAVRTPWADVEDVVRFTVRSIRRKATRWPGCTLKQLQMIDPGELRRRFEKERLARLLDCAS